MNSRAPYSPPCLLRKAPSAQVMTAPAGLHGSIETGTSFAMTMRTRKFFGAIGLLLLAFVWSMLGMALAQLPVIANSGLLQAVYYVVVGMGWVLPAMPIVSWMLRPDRERPQA